MSLNMNFTVQFNVTHLDMATAAADDGVEVMLTEVSCIIRVSSGRPP